MTQGITIWVGADVHKDRIAIAIARGDSSEELEQEFANDPDTIRKLFKKLRKQGELRVCYEAGPCGYTFRRELEALGLQCDVVAPSLILQKPGDKRKTDRLDARKLLRQYRAGLLTLIRVPTEKEEAARDLLRCREDLGEDINRQRHRLLKFLLRHGCVWRETDNWTPSHWRWLRAQRFAEPLLQRTLVEYLALLDFSLDRQKSLDHEIDALAQQEPYKSLVERLKCLKGIGTLTAMIVLTEIQDFRRFQSPRELMNFVGLTPGIHASGGKSHTLSITKTGNGHVRRVLVEAAWSYSRRPQSPSTVQRRCAGQPREVLHEAREAQERLNYRYRHLRQRGKKATVAVVAVARELLGFIWALTVKHEPAAGSQSVGGARSR